MILFPYLPFDLSLLPPDTYLVGGAVRDALLNRKRDYLDLDFVLPQKAVETARNIAKKYKAGFVVLDQERQIARVVLKTGTLDFAQQEGDKIETDLKRRDFTINAIAYDVISQKIIDPFNGLQDLEKQVIKMISSANLEDDPLRLLRAYRQASQLNFQIDPETKLTIEKLSPLIKNIAAERVHTELNYLLKSAQETPWLIEVGKIGLLQPWFKNINLKRLANLSKIDDSAQYFIHKYPELTNLNQREKSWYCLAKLAHLLSSDPSIAETELINLKYSKAEIKVVITILKALPILQEKTSLFSLREKYFFFLDTQKTLPLVVILAKVLNVPENIILPLTDHYFNINDPVAHPVALLTGNDLIQCLNIKPSPVIGKLLTEIAIAQIEDKIKTKEDALIFAKNYLKLNFNY